MKKREFLKSVGLGSAAFSLNPFELFSKSNRKIPQENEVQITIVTRNGSVTINNDTVLNEYCCFETPKILDVNIQDWRNILNFKDVMVKSKIPLDILEESSNRFLSEVIKNNPSKVFILDLNDRLYLALCLGESVLMLERDQISVGYI